MTLEGVLKAAKGSAKPKFKKSLSNIETQELLETGRCNSERKKLAELRKLKLRRKLQEVAEQNETLAKTISDKNAEIAELKRSVQSLNDVLNSVPIDELSCNSSIASTKILELSKKNRQLRAEVETTKHRLNKKEIQIQKLERELKSFEDKIHQEVDSIRKVNSAPGEDFQSKISALQQKLFETRNRNVELQGQLKLAQKCLQQEVGENFNLNILANQPQSNWRGRAQQIIHLQQKLQEAKERLEMYERQAANRVGNVSCANYNNPTIKDTFSLNTINTYPNNSIGEDNKCKSCNLSVISSGTSIGFDRFAPSVRKSEILHRAKVEELEKQISALKTQLEEHRSKILALKVRNKTLNEDMLKYKNKANTLDLPANYASLNMSTIDEQLTIQKYQYESRLDEMTHQIKELIKQRDEAETREAEIRDKLNNIDLIIIQKDNYISQLEENVRKLESDVMALSDGFLFSCRELRKEEFIAILDCLETEKTGLIEHKRTLTERLNKERTKNEITSENLTKAKTVIKRLEMKIRDLERELEAQTERRKRSQRIAEYANSVSGAEQSSVSSFIFENSVVQKLNKPNANAELTMNEITDLKNQLEFATEKITMLEEKVAHLSEEREIDTKAFDEIIVNSKNIIIETILNQKQNIRLEEERDQQTEEITPNSDDAVSLPSHH